MINRSLRQWKMSALFWRGNRRIRYLSLPQPVPHATILLHNVNARTKAIYYWKVKTWTANTRSLAQVSIKYII